MALVLVPDTSQKFEMPSNDARKRRREEVAFIGTRYKKVRQIGEGTYGKVFLATDKETGAAVALKKIRTEEKEGFPITAIREIRILKSLNHPNIINLREIVRSAMDARNDYKGSIYMVFDYMEHDLCGLMERNKITGCHFSTSEVKCLMLQLLQGLQCCHEANIMHRDLKASNILVGEDGQLKLADFGLARGYDHNHLQELGMTNNVITLWYRPPELLLGAKQYTEAVDMWSAGCIFAEMLTCGRHLFMGKTETDMVDAIFSRLGIPTEETWPGVVKLEHWDKVNVEKPRPNTLQRWANKERVERGALALLEGLLQMNPARRTSAALALTADWFREDPLPCVPSEIRKRESSHEWVVKKRRSEIVHGSRAAGVHGGGGGCGAAPAVVRSSGAEQGTQKHRSSSRHHAPSTGDRVHRVPLQPPPPSRSPAAPPHPAAQHVPYPPPSLADAPAPFGCAATFHHPPPSSASARYHPPPSRLGAPQPPAQPPAAAPPAFLAHPPPPHPPPQGPSAMPHR